MEVSSHLGGSLAVLGVLSLFGILYAAIIQNTMGHVAGQATS